MAEFPRNLDDGELWLPPDISNHHGTRRNQDPSTADLARHLAASSLFQARTKSPAIPNFQRLRPPVQFSSLDPADPYRVDSDVNVGPGMVYRNRTVPLHATYKPAYHYNFLKPNRPQVESFVEARARVLQNRLNSRLSPVQGRVGVGVGGFGREYCGGTGVFLPRIVNPSTTNTNFRKKQVSGPRNRRETQMAQQRHMVKRDELEEHCCQFSTSPEMVLPQDWTY